MTLRRGNRPAVACAEIEGIRVTGHLCHQGPFGGHLGRAAQQELSEAENRFDDPEHRFDRLLAQLVELFAGGALQRQSSLEKGLKSSVHLVFKNIPNLPVWIPPCKMVFGLLLLLPWYIQDDFVHRAEPTVETV